MPAHACVHCALLNAPDRVYPHLTGSAWVERAILARYRRNPGVYCAE